jgi:hypothetical protein
MNDTITVTRHEGVWHLTIFTGRPMDPDKPPAETSRPSASRSDEPG